jgi:hypothetical protein
MLACCFAGGIYLLAVHSSRNFGGISFNTRLSSSIIFLGMSFIFVWLSNRDQSTAKLSHLLITGLLMMACSSACFSFARQEGVLLVYSCLFTLPGAMLGGLALNRIRKTDEIVAAFNEGRSSEFDKLPNAVTL